MRTKTTLPSLAAAGGRITLFILPMLCSPTLQASPETDALRQELELLRQRIDELEARLAASEESAVDAKEASSEATATDVASQETIEFGGALRFTYAWKDYDDASETRRGDAGLDLFRINVDGERDNILLSAE